MLNCLGEIDLSPKRKKGEISPKQFNIISFSPGFKHFFCQQDEITFSNF